MEKLTYYNQAASICGRIYNELKNDIINGERNIKNLSIKGNEEILKELSTIYKKGNVTKHIAFPVSISLNNCVGNYVYSTGNDDFNTIKDDSIIKIELGVSIAGCISVLAETFTIIENTQVYKINQFLTKIQKNILNMICHEETADEIRMYIESECTENDVFPVENCTSFQQEKDFLHTNESKYMILNYKQENQQNENINYEFEKNDVYTINLSVTPSTDTDIKYKISNETHIYNFNEYQYSLKLKASRTFYNDVTSKHSYNAFLYNDYNSIGYRLGMKECLQHDILNKFPIIYILPKNVPVITKKFTIIVGDSKSKILKYN